MPTTPKPPPPPNPPRPLHYWDGYGCLCMTFDGRQADSLSTADKAKVTCQVCRDRLELGRMKHAGPPSFVHPSNFDDDEDCEHDRPRSRCQTCENNSLRAEVAAQRAKRETTMNEAMRLCEATFHERIASLTQERDALQERLRQPHICPFCTKL
jgi:hypothetical protein